MSEHPTHEPFEPYRPGPAGAEQPHPGASGASQPAAWAPPSQSPQSPYSYGDGYRSAQQTHPQATLVLVLGVISLFSGVVGPVAWVMGSRVKKEIERSGGRWGGQSQVMVGHVMGIVMTVLMALTVLMVVGVFLVIFAAAVAST